MKRKAILLLAGMLLLTCSACGKNEGSGQAENLTPPTVSQQAEVAPEHVPSAESEVPGEEPLSAEGGDGQRDRPAFPAVSPAPEEEINAKMKENLDFRHSKQPSLALPNCGSVFRNPEGDSAGRLLEASGAKNIAVGGAHVYEKHANFIINDKAGTSLDILQIMYKMYNGVKEKFGIELKPEVRYLGGNNEKEVEICRKLKMIK